MYLSLHQPGRHAIKAGQPAVSSVQRVLEERLSYNFLFFSLDFHSFSYYCSYFEGEKSPLICQCPHQTRPELEKKAKTDQFQETVFLGLLAMIGRRQFPRQTIEKNLEIASLDVICYSFYIFSCIISPHNSVCKLNYFFSNQNLIGTLIKQEDI